MDTFSIYFSFEGQLLPKNTKELIFLEIIFVQFLGQSRPPRGGGYGGGNRNRSQGWVDYNYDYEAAGLDKRQGSANRVSNS